MFLTIDTGTTNTRIYLVDGETVKDSIKINAGAGDTAKTGSNQILKESIQNGICRLLSDNTLKEQDICAVFASGMKSIGLTGALVDAMKGSQSIAMVSAAIGPWLMAIVCGSGNAAALAFNEVITPHAADFGMTVVQLGAVAQVAAGLGRTISPVAGGVIVIASIAGVNPIDICKRTFIPVCVALVVFTIGMYFF